MKKTIKSILLLGALAIGAGTLASCSDDDDSYMSRLFRPVVSTDNITAGVDNNKKAYIYFSWDDYASANKYIIKLVTEDGSDSLKYAVNTTEIMVNNLLYDTNYNISIRAVDTISGKESRDYVFTVTSADYPTKLKTPGTTDIIDVGARIAWDNSEGDANYDSLQVVKASNDSVISTYVLTDEDRAVSEKVISGLKANTNYRVKAYIAGEYQGKKNFKTVAAEDFGDDLVVDMRNVEESKLYKCLSISSDSQYDGLLDSLISVNPLKNITIVLPGGADIKMPTMNLKKGTEKRIKFVTGLTLAGNANICVAGNFAIAADVHVSSLVFDKINFTDAPLDGKDKDGSNFGGTYLFNLNGAGASIDTIKITNSNIKYKRGVCRLQNAVTIGNFTIDNCIVDSIGGYGIVNCDANKSTVDYVTITNSTFANCEKFIVVNSGKTDNSINNVKVANCTFAYCIANTKSFFDMKDRELKTYTLDNCLFGKPGPHNKEEVTDGITGYSGSIAPSCNDCYFASDFLWQKNAETGEAKAALSGTTLKGATSDIFKSPDTSDFTVMSSEARGIGDPRWY